MIMTEIKNFNIVFFSFSLAFYPKYTCRPFLLVLDHLTKWLHLEYHIMEFLLGTCEKVSCGIFIHVYCGRSLLWISLVINALSGCILAWNTRTGSLYLHIIWSPNYVWMAVMRGYLWWYCASLSANIFWESVVIATRSTSLDANVASPESSYNKEFHKYQSIYCNFKLE